MKIKFQTKEQSNKEQREAFLKLSPVERFYAFLDLSERMSKFPRKELKKEKKNNFEIVIKRK